MSITNGYATLAEVQASLGIADALDNDALELDIETASRLIDQECGRRFYRVNETRVYTAQAGDRCRIDDCGAVSALVTDEDNDRTYETTWAVTDWELEPVNAALDGEPYHTLRTTPEGDYTFPTHRRGVQVTGTFGYSATAPKLIQRACILQAARFYMRRKTPIGLQGVAELGQAVFVKALDPDVQAMLAPYRLIPVG